MSNFISAMFNGMSNRSKGVFLSVVGVLALTPDSILVRKVAHVPNATVLFYRNVIFATVMLIGLLVTEKWNTWNKLRSLGRWGFFTGIVFGASLWFIIVGIQNTAAANVLVIQASNPVFAAIFSYLIMGETMSRLTLGTSAVCVLAIALIFAGSTGGESTHGNNTLGLIYAVASSVSFGLYMVMLRWLAVFQTVEIDMMPCNVVGGYFAALLSLCMGSDLTDLTGVDSIYILLQGIGVLAVGFTLITMAPTYIPSPEVSLYTLIETVLGPVWVYLGGYESPSIYAVCGGVILLIALAVHSIMSLSEPVKVQDGDDKQVAVLDAAPAAVSATVDAAVSEENKVLAFEEIP